MVACQSTQNTCKGFLSLQNGLSVWFTRLHNHGEDHAWTSGISIGEICAAAGWSLPSTIARFYNLDVPAMQARVLSVRDASIRYSGLFSMLIQAFLNGSDVGDV